MENDVFLKAINNSPKFRKNYIVTKIKKQEDLSKKICHFFDLNLVRDIYLLQIRKESYNSKKRRQLKTQEIIFIKKIQIYQTVNYYLDKMQLDIKNLDAQFTNEFKENYHFGIDKEFFEILMNQGIEDYFKEEK